MQILFLLTAIEIMCLFCSFTSIIDIFVNGKGDKPVKGKFRLSGVEE